MDGGLGCAAGPLVAGPSLAPSPLIAAPPPPPPTLRGPAAPLPSKLAGEEGTRSLDGFLKAGVFILSACQQLMIELKKFCHEKQFEKLFEKYISFKV